MAGRPDASAGEKFSLWIQTHGTRKSSNRLINRALGHLSETPLPRPPGRVVSSLVSHPGCSRTGSCPDHLLRNLDDHMGGNPARHLPSDSESPLDGSPANCPADCPDNHPERNRESSRADSLPRCSADSPVSSLPGFPDCPPADLHPGRIPNARITLAFLLRHFLLDWSLALGHWSFLSQQEGAGPKPAPVVRGLPPEPAT